MKKKRIEELEQNISEIQPEYRELVQLFQRFTEAVKNEDETLALSLRREADPWFRKDGKFTKLAYFPPNDADVSGIIDPYQWDHFVKYDWGAEIKTKTKRSD